jgi:hypothetical protein
VSPLKIKILSTRVRACPCTHPACCNARTGSHSREQSGQVLALTTHLINHQGSHWVKLLLSCTTMRSRKDTLDATGSKIPVTKFCTEALSIYRVSVWHLLYVTHLALQLSKWFLYFCKICAALNCLTTVGNMTSKWIGWDVEGRFNFLIWGSSICLKDWGIQIRPSDAEVPSIREYEGT